KAMAKEIEARYASMDELASALAGYLDRPAAPPVAPLRPGSGRPPQSRWRLGLAVLGGLACLGLALGAALWGLVPDGARQGSGQAGNGRSPVDSRPEGEGVKGKAPRGRPTKGEVSPPVRILIARLKDKDVTERESAAESLEKLGDRAA